MLSWFSGLVAAWFATTITYSDLRARRIANRVSYPTALWGLLAAVAGTALLGANALASSVLGATLAFALLLPFFVMRKTGGGDLKALVAFGALGGPSLVLEVLALGSLTSLGLKVLERVFARPSPSVDRSGVALGAGFGVAAIAVLAVRILGGDVPLGASLEHLPVLAELL